MASFEGEKITPVVVDVECDRRSSLTSQTTELPKRPTSSIAWAPTFIQFGPLSGIFCLGLALTSIVASLGILAGSDGRPVQNWNWPVSTYLAIFTAIANLSIRYAVLQGVVVTWWLRASKGSSLAKLHWDWRQGTSLRGAIASGKHIGMLGIACIFSTLVVVDGPLLQRASTIISMPYNNVVVPMNVSMAMEVPRYFTGTWATAQQSGSTQPWSWGFNDTIPTNNGTASNDIYSIPSGPHWEHAIKGISGWLKGSPIADVVTGCPGTCSAQIKAPMIYPTLCTQHSVPPDGNVTDYSKMISGLLAAPLGAQQFLIAVNLLLDDDETVNLVVGRSNLNDNCYGPFEYSVCTLQSAIGVYDVEIQNNEIMMQNVPSPRLISLANNTAVSRTFLPQQGGSLSTLGGLVAMMFTSWSSVIYSLANDGGPYMEFQNGADALIFEDDFASQCNKFADPFPTVMDSFNKLMFYTGAAAAQDEPSYLASSMDSNLPIDTVIDGQLQGSHNVFSTSYLYFLAVALIELFCVAMILPSYWNFWKLGRTVSLSPLEIAKAFQSPILADCNSNATGRELASCAGDVVVQYGALKGHGEQDNSKMKLVLADRSLIDQPAKGELFGP